MEETGLRVTETNENGRTKYIVSQDIPEGGTKKIEIEQVENGYIVEALNDHKENGEWKYETKRYISTTNPLDAIKKSDKTKPKEPETMSTDEIVAGIKGFLGEIPG